MHTNKTYSEPFSSRMTILLILVYIQADLNETHLMTSDKCTLRSQYDSGKSALTTPQYAMVTSAYG